MRYKTILVSSLILVVIALFIPKVLVANRPIPPAYGFDVSIAPDTETIGTFSATLMIKELASNKVVAQPTIRFRSGESAQTNAGQTQDGLSFQFSVAVDRDAPTAQYSVEVLQGEDIISQSRAKIALQ